MTCKKCGSEETIESQNGPHTQARCAKCNSFIKFIPKQVGEINWATQVVYFGKYKDRLFKDIAIVDPKYIRWMAETFKKNKMKQISEEAIFEFKL